MKTTTLALFLFSHGALVMLGGWLANEPKKESTPVAALPAPAKPVSPRPPEQASGNPIFRATAADFRAAWDELQAGARGDRESLFVDWCAVDPDGAIQALGRLHPPKSAQDYLRSAQMYHAAEMAPALVKHWRKLERLPEYKVQFALGWSVNELARKDPATAASLLGSLPPGMRTRAYDRVFSGLDGVVVEQLVKSMPPLPSGATEEKTALWNEVAEAVDTAGTKKELWVWMAEANDTAARRALATQGMRKASMNEDWSGFFDAVERMDANARIEMRDLVRETTSNANYRPEARAAISAECLRHGFDDWLEGPTTE
jgi:hypothetical protein